MARKDEEMPEIPVGDAETPTGDVTLESGAKGDDLASTASSPALSVPPVAEAPAEEEGAEAEAAPAAAETAPEAPGEPQVRRYRPSEDYAEGDRIIHPIWNTVGVVVHRDPQERIFRIPIGRTEERGRCHLIRVEFDNDVPANGGPTREVTLIADWHGRPFEVGAPAPASALPEPEPLLAAAEAERPAPRRMPALPEIPEPDEEFEEDEVVEEDPEDEENEPIGI